MWSNHCGSLQHHYLFARTNALTDKRERVWFRRWFDTNLTTPTKTAPQDHTGLMGVLRNVATRLHTAEALFPVLAAQRKAGKETKGLYRLPPMAQRVILAASATNGTSIPTSLPPTLHHLLNASNTTALQVYCALIYTGNHLYLQTSYMFKTSFKGTSWRFQTRTRQQDYCRS